MNMLSASIKKNIQQSQCDGVFKKETVNDAFNLSVIEDENSILRQILTSSSDPILITSKDAIIVYVNRAWEKLTGYSYEEVMGNNPKFLQSGKTPLRVYKKMWRTLSQGKTFTSDEVVNKKKNGTEYAIRSNVYPIICRGKVTYYVQLQHDITEAKRLDGLRKEFLSASAHELKTPITVLKLLTHSHLKKAIGQGQDAVGVRELALMDRELNKLTGLINDMLDVTRFETGRQFMAFEKTDLGNIIEKTVEQMQVYAKKHIVRVGKMPDQVKVIVDPARIEQVLLNLLSNAVKYSPEGTHITVSLEKKDKSAVVSVKDQGAGIPKSDQGLIFDRYYKVKTKSKIGYGLGLYISKEIIKRHKGKIWVESRPGHGSTFNFSLPLAA